MSPDHENSGRDALLKVPSVHQKQVLKGIFLWWCSLLLWLNCIYLQPSQLQCPTLLVVGEQTGFYPCVVRGPVQRCHRLAFGQCQQSNWMLTFNQSTRSVVALNCWAISLCCPLRGFHWWVRPVVRQNAYPSICLLGLQSHCLAGHSLYAASYMVQLLGLWAHW